MKTPAYITWIAVALVLASLPCFSETTRLTTDRYLDKCKGAWAGQMIGVCFGDAYEFKSNGKPITEPLREWKPEFVKGAIGQDDCYVEMTFLKAIEDYGLDVTFEQAGKAFADSKYDLWHANMAGRQNVRRGIMPPMSGHPENNRHADDIDFQIESDLFGILCPGLPGESNRLCDIFGHIMNYGDGVYGGMFVAGMYAAAYFEDTDVLKVVREGLACIPEASTYHKCISDVIQWHTEQPNDWLATWKKLEEKWQDDVDCMPGNPFNIDAKLNGAYVVIGLLYGAGDMAKTMEFATRCGQDTDCNASNAAGVLGCMKGFANIPDQFKKGIAEIENQNFSFTNYSFKTLIPTCRRVTEQIILRAGGTVQPDAYVIPRQAPRAPEKLEQWSNKKEMLATPLTDAEVRVWNSAWHVVACGPDMSPGLRDKEYGRPNVLVIHPVSPEKPAVLTATITVPASLKPTLDIEITSDQRGDFLLKVFIDDKVVNETVIDTKGEWKTVSVDLAPYARKTIAVRIENHATGWSFEAAYLHTVTIGGVNVDAPVRTDRK